MADSANNLSCSVGLDTTAFKSGVAQLTQSIRDIETNFRASAAVMGDWSSTSDGLKERVSSLGEKLDLQKQKLSTLREQFVALQNAEGDNSKAMASIASQMSTVERAISSTQSQIDKYSSALKESESPAAGLQEKLSGLSQQIQLSASKFNVTAAAMGDWASKTDGLRAKLESLREIESSQKQQVSELESVYSKIIQKEGENSSAATSMAIKLNEARAAFEKTGSDIRTFSSDLSATEAKEKEQSSALGKLKTAFQELGDKAKSSGSGMSNVLSGLKGSIAGFAGGMMASLSWNTLISATDSAEKTTAQMEAVLKSTGGAAGMTAKQLTDLAASQAKVTTYSAGTTKQAENMLLTFTNIKSNVFPQTIKASEDMATAMGMSATDAAKTLGKALNDPAAGLSKLTKQGVTFTDAQKQQIDAMVKSGNTAGAQTVMLQELEKEFGGSAKAAGSTLAGQTQIMQNNLKSAGVQIATSLMPIAQTVLPMIIQGAQGLAASITAHKSEIQGAVKEVTTVIKDVFGFITTHGPLIKGLIIGIGGAFVAWESIKAVASVTTTVSNFATGVKKIGDVAKGAKSGLDTIRVAGMLTGDKIKDVTSAVGSFSSKIGGGAITGLKTFGGALKTAGSGAGELISSLAQTAAGFAKTGAAAAAAAIKFAVQKAASLAVAAAEKVQAAAQWLLNAAMDANPIGIIIIAVAALIAGLVLLFNKCKPFHDFVINSIAVIKAAFFVAVEAIKTAFGAIIGFFQGVWNGIVTIFSVVGSWFAGVFGTAWAGIQAAWSVVTGFFSGIWNGIVAVFSVVAGWFASIFGAAVSGVQSAWSGITGFFSGIWNTITSIFKPDMLTNIGHQLIEGLWNGINNAVGWIKGKLEGFKDAVMGALKSFFGIHSPSTLFRDEIGKNLALGIGEGFSNNIASVSEKMKKSMQGISSSVSSGISVSYGGIKSAASALSGGLQSSVIPAVAGGYGQSSVQSIDNSVTKAPVININGPVNVQSKGSQNSTLQQLQFLANIS